MQHEHTCLSHMQILYGELYIFIYKTNILYVRQVYIPPFKGMLEKRKPNKKWEDFKWKIKIKCFGWK